ncbi:MAG: CPBP family intramembrane glutamic endopeptidase [Cyanobacteria bacterium P01_A01_bin.114]
MTRSYLKLAQQGKNSWWRYLLGVLLVLFFWQVLGSIPLLGFVAALEADGDPATAFNPITLSFEGVAPLVPYLVLNASIILSLVGLYIAMRWLHQRPFTGLITPEYSVSWRRFFQGFGVYFGLIAIATLLEALIFPGSYQLSFQPGQFFLFLVFAVMVTPIQASAEELFFRGYLMQGLGLKSRGMVLPVMGSSILFMLPHLLNPEVQLGFAVMATIYLLFGLFLAVITVQDNRLELAMGAHSANNLFIVLVANYDNSALPSPSIWSAELHPQFALVSFVAIAILFYLILLRRSPKRPLH